jgi:hypothetical protein
MSIDGNHKMNQAFEGQPMSETPERDALDHIMRVARATMQPTRRLDWIALRAKYALEGKPWSRDVRETPTDRVAADRSLRERLLASEAQKRRYETALQWFVECDLNDCASLEVASARIRNIARAALARQGER